MEKKISVKNGKSGWMKKTILILAVIFLSFITASAFTVVKDGSFWLEAENMGKENYIYLEWQDTGTDQFYTIYQCNDYDEVTETGSWENRSASYGKNINVLNLYPRDDADGLKEWMEDNTESETGEKIGRDKISVDKVELSLFNASLDPETEYLKDGSGEYKYDVIAFGFWDSNANLDLSNQAMNATEKYILSGHGVLFGHDTQRAVFPNFAYLGQHYLNLEIDNGATINAVGGSLIQSSQEGFLLEYPWDIPFGVEFEVPPSHSSFHIAYGKIWMDYVKPFTLYSSEETIRNGGSSNVYLTTYNNIEDSGDYIDFDEKTAVFYPAAADGTLSYTMNDLKNYLHIKAEDWAGDEARNKPGNISEAVRISPYDFNWGFTVTKDLDLPAVTEQSFLFMIERRLEAAGAAEEIYYGIAKVPIGSSSAEIHFEHMLPGVYTVTEKDANWSYQLDSSTPKEQPVILLDSLNPKGQADYQNNVMETAWIHGKDNIENIMIEIQ